MTKRARAVTAGESQGQHHHLDGPSRGEVELLEVGCRDGAGAVGARPAGAADALRRGAGALAVAVRRAHLRGCTN